MTKFRRPANEGAREKTASGKRKPPGNSPSRPRSGHAEDEAVVGLRIIGGTLRGRKIEYSGDMRTRPMKDRVREAVFNLLGYGVTGAHAIDLFAGTGAMALEALSRGATKATCIERHYPTAKLIERGAAELGIADRLTVVFGDAFLWTKKFDLPFNSPPFVVFCSPPYDFFVERKSDMLNLITRWLQIAPTGSHFVVETDDRFDPAELPNVDAWDIRTYFPAVVGIWEKRAAG